MSDWNKLVDRIKREGGKLEVDADPHGPPASKDEAAAELGLIRLDRSRRELDDLLREVSDHAE